MSTQQPQQTPPNQQPKPNMGGGGFLGLPDDIEKPKK